MIDLDFFIPDKYRGKVIELPKVDDLPKEDVDLSVPKDAFYLEINPLEDNDEFLDSDDLMDTWRQELRYYDQNKRFIRTQDLDGSITTSRLMSRLEKVFERQY